MTRREHPRARASWLRAATTALLLGGGVVACGTTGQAPSPAASVRQTRAPTVDQTPTKAFSSSVGGYSLRLPATMDAKPATAAAPFGVYTWSDADPFLDQFFGEGIGPMDIVSAPLPSGITAAAWTKTELDAALLTGSAFPAVCAATAQTEPITVDGHPGTLDTHCAPALLTAIVPAANRIYVINLHGDPPDRAWFTTFLASVRLDPAAALPAPAGSPIATHS